MPRSSSSNRGFHFYMLHKKCPWKFYLQYGVKLQPKKIASALLNGQAFHTGKEVFYETFSKQKALDAICDTIESNSADYPREDEYDLAFSRFPVMLESWIDEWATFDKDNYKIIEVEMELEVPVAGTPYTHTMRLDTVVQEKYSDKVYILETKTTSFSLDSMIKTVSSGDQATAYTWGLKKMRPDLNVIGVIPDITYWHKSSKDPGKIVNHRADTVIRSDQSLREYEAHVAYEIRDISEKMKAIENKTFKPIEIFPRYTHTCNDFFRECPFHWICRDRDVDAFTPETLPPDLEFNDRKDIGLMSEMDK